MQRQHPLLSATGLAMTVLVIAVLGIVYWLTGGRMFSPGALASPHAEIEDCAACHQPLQVSQAILCLDCHTEIEEEMQTEDGLHARLETPDQCRACHPDHRGVDFDVRLEGLAGFNHDLTAFSLARHTADYAGDPIACAACHTGDDFEPLSENCTACHAGQDPNFMVAHQANLGADCLACHDGRDSMANFNHASTAFPLTGEHTQTACADCHSAESLIAGITGAGSGLETRCAACHAEPAVHAGLFQSACEDCHATTGWSPAQINGADFDHFTQTGFSLVHHDIGFDGELLNCRSCHVESLLAFEETVCEQCHTAGNAEFMAVHISDFGTSCLECHDGLDSMQDFDHSTVFVLDGSHDDLACASCHVVTGPDGEPVHRFDGTPTDCAGCHAEPAIHAGLFGLDCASCHNTFAWRPASLSSHTFPLDHGGEGQIPCSVCHVSTFVEYTCDRCHAPAEMVEEHNDEDIFNIAGRCADCHPTGREGEAED